MKNVLMTYVYDFIITLMTSFNFVFRAFISIGHLLGRTGLSYLEGEKNGVVWGCVCRVVKMS